jgi:hypothetical protein
MQMCAKRIERGMYVFGLCSVSANTTVGWRKAAGCPMVTLTI